MRSGAVLPCRRCYPSPLGGCAATAAAAAPPARRRSSGSVRCICSAQSGQNVHSKLQMRASSPCPSGASHRSQTARISRAMRRGYAPAAMQPIDLRSDTVTRPTPAMREAMATAEVGDDVWGDDPTVIELEREVAALLGKAAALYVPSGTMGNQIAIRCQTRPGDEILVHELAHVIVHEAGGVGGVVERADAHDRRRARPARSGSAGAVAARPGRRAPRPPAPDLHREHHRRAGRPDLPAGSDRRHRRLRPPARHATAHGRRPALERRRRQRQRPRPDRARRRLRLGLLLEGPGRARSGRPSSATPS